LQRVSGNSAIFPSFPGSQFLPARIGLRRAFSRWFDMGADVNWGEGGLQLRGGPLDAAREVPWGVEAEWRTGLTSLSGKQSLLFQRNVFRLRAEAYPALPLGRTSSGLPTCFAVGSLGLSAGRQLASIWNIPDAYDQVEEGPFLASLDALRWEARLEATLGFHFLDATAHSIAFQPWITLPLSGPRSVECRSCSLTLERLSAGWGFSAAWTFYLVFDDDPPPAAPRKRAKRRAMNRTPGEDRASPELQRASRSVR
jgi:hypothetical protein